jgi:phosphoribosylformylglycinamidine synthase subunit PurQ / glutaminase
MIRALVLSGFGINCEEELAAAWRLAGAEPTIAHLNDIFAGAVRIRDFHVLNFPGGFSFGDDLGAGRVLANRIRFRKLPGGGTLLSEIGDFARNGGFVLGICNGFQVLVKLGLLPDTNGSQEQEVSLAGNDSGSFEDRWVLCGAPQPSVTPFLDGIDTLPLPVRHGEGKLVVRDAQVRERIVSQGLACLVYCGQDGRPTDAFPANPNGSDLFCAGLSDPSGRIFGLMPHPEAFLSAQNHPDWARRARERGTADGPGEGLRIFQNLVRHLEGEKSR